MRDSTKAIDKLAAHADNPSCADLKVCIANEPEDLDDLVHKVSKAQTYKKDVMRSWNLFCHVQSPYTEYGN